MEKRENFVGTCSVAWAAGLFDAEGSATSHRSRRRARAQRELLVYQAGGENAPEVLKRFQETVECGTLLGPARGRLWSWRVSNQRDVAHVARTLWPWLSTTKRGQFVEISTRTEPSFAAVIDELTFRSGPIVVDGPEAIAWAGGFFVGEGWISCRLPAPSSRWPQLRAAITQAGAAGVPHALLRFRAATKLGAIAGPYVSTSPWSRLPQFKWSIGSDSGTRRLVDLLWPWLDSTKRNQATNALAAMDAYLASRRRPRSDLSEIE